MDTICDVFPLPLPHIDSLLDVVKIRRYNIMKIFNKSISTRDLILISMLMALTIVLERNLSIQTLGIRIGFAFVPVACTAMLYGPAITSVSYAIADFIGITLYPTGGGYFPGFTITALLTGAIYGLFLYNKKKTFLNIGIAVSLVCLLLNLGLDTLWLYVLLKDGVVAYIPGRITKALVMIPVQFVIIRFMWYQVFCRLPQSLKTSLDLRCES